MILIISKAFLIIYSTYIVNMPKTDAIPPSNRSSKYKFNIHSVAKQIDIEDLAIFQFFSPRLSSTIFFT